jgi:predicted membrane chloride channel (bestrophin family)
VKGLVGLELVSTEIEDPFGEDPNDFCVDVLVQVSVENHHYLKLITFLYCLFN